MSAAQTVFHFASGDAPLLVSMPHVGTELPAGFAQSGRELGESGIVRTEQPRRIAWFGHATLCFARRRLSDVP